jgi:phosphatidate cytidylyltransferase
MQKDGEDGRKKIASITRYVTVGLGLITALAGVAGDLVESLMKREVDVKDSGVIMPGHGGFLDRFDALYISVPFVVVYLIIISL